MTKGGEGGLGREVGGVQGEISGSGQANGTAQSRSPSWRRHVLNSILTTCALEVSK